MAWQKSTKPKSVVVPFRIDKEEEHYPGLALEKSGETLSEFCRQAVSDRIALTLIGPVRDGEGVAA